MVTETGRWQARPVEATLVRVVAFAIPLSPGWPRRPPSSRRSGGPHRRRSGFRRGLAVGVATATALVVDPIARRLLRWPRCCRCRCSFPAGPPSRLSLGLGARQTHGSGRTPQHRPVEPHGGRGGRACAQAGGRPEPPRPHHPRPLRAGVGVRAPHRRRAGPVPPRRRPPPAGPPCSTTSASSGWPPRSSTSGAGSPTPSGTRSKPPGVRCPAGRSARLLARTVGRRGQPAPRAVRRHRLSPPARRRGHLARRSDRGRHRHLRRHHLGPVLQAAGLLAPSPSRTRPLRRHPVRPEDRRRVRQHLHRPGPVHGGTPRRRRPAAPSSPPSPKPASRSARQPPPPGPSPPPPPSPWAH